MTIILVALLCIIGLALIVWLVKEWIKGIRLIKKYNRMKIQSTLIDADEYELDKLKVQIGEMTETEFRCKWRTK